MMNENNVLADEPSRKRPIEESILPDEHNEELIERLKKLMGLWADEVRTKYLLSFRNATTSDIYLIVPFVVKTGTNERKSCIL